VGYDARQPRPRAVGWQHLEDLEAEEEEQEGAKAGGCRSGSVGSSRNAGAMREQGTSRNAMLRKLQMMTLEMERTQKEVSLLNAQVRDLEVRYDEAYLRRADGDETKAVSEVIVGLHIPAREGLKVMLRKQLVDVLFPDLWADSLGGPGNVVWVDDGSLAAATAAIRVPSGEAAAADPSDQEGWERQVRGRAGAVCEVIWEATGKQISYPTGLLGEYRLASYDTNLAIKSRILSAGGNSSQISACNGSEDALNGLLHQFLSEQQGTLAPRAEDGQGASTDLSRASSRSSLGLPTISRAASAWPRRRNDSRPQTPASGQGSIIFMDVASG